MPLGLVLRWTLALAAVTTVVNTCSPAAERLPRFEDYPVKSVFAGKPAAPKLSGEDARIFSTRIREGVRKGWAVDHSGLGQGKPGPNFAGRYIVIRWGCGSPCVRMAIVDAETGAVISPPITAKGIGTGGFELPLLTLGNRVSRTAEVRHRLDSRMMIVRATPVQSRDHPSFDYYFLREVDSWTFLKRVPLPEDTWLPGDP